MSTDIASLKIKVDTKEVKTATNDLDTLGKQSGSTGSAAAALSTQFLGVVTVVAAAAMAFKAAVDAATKYQNALNGLASVARYAGEDVGATMQKSLELTSDGLLSVSEGATALKNLLARGFSTDEAVTMINRFKDAAAFGRQSSLDFGQAVVSATEGIKNENSILVDNAGVTKNVSIMWKEYAAQIGKSVGELSQAEKRTAEYNGVLAETEGQLGNAQLALNGVDGANAKLSKTFTDMSVTIGQSLTPAYIGLTNAIADGFKFASENAIKPFLFYFENIGIRLGETSEKFRVFFDVLANPKSWGTGKLTEEFKRLEALSEEMRIGIVERLNGTPAPVMGKDSGKRRQDVVIHDTAGKIKTVKQTENKRATDLASDYKELLSAANELNKAEQTNYEILQEKLNAMSGIDPLVKAYIQSNIDLAKATSLNNEAEKERGERIAENVRKQIEFNAEVERVKDSIDTQREYNREIAKLAEMYNMGRLSAEEFSKAAQKSQQDMLGFKEETKDGFADLERAIDGFAKNSATSMADFIFGTKTSFGDMVNSMLKDIARLALQKSIFDPIAKGITDSIESSGGIGGWMKSLIPGFANGSDYIPRDMVANIHQGERILTRDENRNYSQNGGNVSVNVTVNSDGSSNVQSDASFGKQLGNAIKSVVQAEMLKQKRQGGLLSA